MEKTAGEEADRVAKEIIELHKKGVPYKDITLLYRAHYVTRNLEEKLLKKKIPYTIYSGTQFFGRMEIKDALCYLRMIVSQDDMAFRRIINKPKRNIGQRRMEFLTNYASENGCTLFEALRKNVEEPTLKCTGAADFIELIDTFAKDSEGKPVSEVLSAILDESGYEKMLRTDGSQERLDNLAELKQSVFEYETTCGEETNIVHYLEHAALFSNMDTGEGQDKVKLMTVHTAKGLEFPYVFICGMNEGIFPSRKTRTVNAMEEERRLAFVAMTRAEKALYITEAGGANLDGSPRYPSRFILDIDRDKLEFDSPVDEQLMKETMVYVGRSTAFLQEDKDETTMEAGTRVRHPVFGPGTIVEVDGSAHAYLIKFDSMPTMRQISFHARLFKL